MLNSDLYKYKFYYNCLGPWRISKKGVAWRPKMEKYTNESHFITIEFTYNCWLDTSTDKSTIEYAIVITRNIDFWCVGKDMVLLSKHMFFAAGIWIPDVWMCSSNTHAHTSIYVFGKVNSCSPDAFHSSICACIRECRTESGDEENWLPTINEIRRNNRKFVKWLRSQSQIMPVILFSDRFRRYVYINMLFSLYSKGLKNKQCIKFVRPFSITFLTIHIEAHSSLTRIERNKYIKFVHIWVVLVFHLFYKLGLIVLLGAFRIFIWIWACFYVTPCGNICVSSHWISSLC